MKRLSPVFDLIFLLLFVGIGRSTHHHGVTIAGMASTTWPFFVGLVGGWLLVLGNRRAPESPGSGVVVVAATVIVGMVLRVVAGQGTAVAFIIVALAFLTLFFVGWRWVRVWSIGHRRTPERPGSE